MQRHGWEGWDSYAPFYDWENARTRKRTDVQFWRRVAVEARGPVLELGCGTGRILLPLSRATKGVVGIDRSQPMLARAQRKIDVARRRRQYPAPMMVRGDIRALPFPSNHFA